MVSRFMILIFALAFIDCPGQSDKESECKADVVVYGGTSAAVSSSHIAYGFIRMEPVFMILGQSAGLVAGLAIDYDLGNS